MINDVLDLSRIESGNLRLQTETAQPDRAGRRDASRWSRATPTARGITIAQDLGAGTAALLGDATRVKQILTNLLSNAVKYNCDGGRIHDRQPASAAATPSRSPSPTPASA